MSTDMRANQRIAYKGQSLIEVLIAMTVIIIGLTSAATMVFSNIRLQERSADRIVAANLAREGVELAKALRDSNWLANKPFNDGMSVGTDYTGVPVMELGRFKEFNFTPATINDNTWTVLKRSTHTSSTGMFVQGTGTAGTNTYFKRLVTFQPICSDGSVVNEGSTCIAMDVVGIRITSRVLWSKRNATLDSVVVDDMYDWR